MKKTYLLLFLLIAVIGCEKEEISENNDAEIANELSTQKIQFSEIPYLITKILDEEKNIKNKKSDSSNSFGSARTNIPAYRNEDKTGITYTIALHKIKKSKSSEDLYFDNLVLKQLKDGSIKKCVIRYKPKEDWFYNTDRDLTNYSGKIIIFDIEGNQLSSMKIEAGQTISETKNLDSKITCSYTLKEVWYFGSAVTYVFEETCESGTGGGTGGYGDTTNTDSGWDSGYTSGDTGGGTGTTAGGISTISANPILDDNGEFVEEETVEIFVELEGKELCAYNRLKWAGVNASNYVNLMTQLFIEFGEGNIGAADLVVTERDLLDSTGNVYRGGGTFQTNDGKFEIVLSRMGNSSSIEIAAVLVHEMAHAFLAKHYSLYNNSFEELYSTYLNDHGLASYSHDIMGDKFINRMARVLYDYDNTLFINFDDYKLLASAGVYEFDEDQLAEYNLVLNYAKINDERCQNVD